MSLVDSTCSAPPLYTVRLGRWREEKPEIAFNRVKRRLLVVPAVNHGGQTLDGDARLSDWRSDNDLPDSDAINLVGWREDLILL